ncbi:MAG TPA: phosphoribosyl-ATP diphosphatase [Stellaceae bacterium]
MGNSSKGKHAAAGGDLSDTAPLTKLFDALAGQSGGKVHNARTVKLLSSGLAKMSQKLVEEAAEVAIDAVRERREGVVIESADLLYHLVVLWFALGIDPASVWAEMGRREQLFGLAEKPPKSRP